MKHLFRILLIPALLLFANANISAQTLGETIEGLWSIGDGDHSKVEFTKTSNGKWQGIIVETDVDRSIGKLLFKEGVYDSKTDKIVGILLHPDSGWGVTGTVILDHTKQIQVIASKFFLSKTFYWTRT